MRTSPGAILLVALLPMTLAAAEGAGSAHKSWAVVSSAGLRESGLADLVALELLKPGRPFDLVERDRIDAVLKEHRLEATLGSEGVGARLRIGRLLGADALVLLSEPRAGGAGHVKLVVSDCRHGARLRIEFFPLAEGEVKELARSVARTVEETRARFARGVERIIGVSHFVSRSLVHDYDHLQAGLAYLLESALAAYPGVAVIETEEAHAIRRELELAGGTVRRTVPLVVEGEFDVAGAASKKNETVRIEARVSDARRVVRTIGRRDLPLGEAAEFVRVELAPAVVGLSEGAAVKPFPAEKQFARLASRADVFARLGAWEHSTGLREAALLLDPSSAEQRGTLIEEYCRIVRRPFDLPKSVRWEPGIEPYERACAAKLARWRLALEHVEYLIRNRLVQRKRAVGLSEHVLGGIGCNTGSEHLPAAEVTKRRFLRDVYPLILALECPSQHRSRPGNRVRPGSGHTWRTLDREKWLGIPFKPVLTRYDRTFHTKEDLDFILDILEGPFPDVMPLSSLFTRFLHGVPYRFGNPDTRFTEAEYRRFLQALKESEKASNVIYGRYGLLTLALKAGIENDPEGLQREARALSAFCAKHGIRRQSILMSGVTSALRAIKRHMDFVKKGYPRGYRRPGPPTGPSRRRPAAAREGDRLKFVAVPMHMRRLSGKTVPLTSSTWRGKGAARFLRCGKALDVVWMWYGGAVYLMREKGLLVEAEARAKRILDATWDGRSVWLGTASEGIWILDASGGVARKIAADDGLPPCERGVVLHPLAPGKVFAAGSFGDHRRGWCAVLERDGKTVRVNVFHKATRVLSWEERGDKRLGETFGADATIAFVPRWAHEYQHDRGDGSRVLLVGRRMFAPGLGLRPLAIDLGSLKVVVSEFRLGSGGYYYSHSYLSMNGELFEAGDFCVTRRAPPGTVLGNGRNCIGFCVPKNPEGVRFGGLLKTLVPYRGFIYVPASTIWFRFDPDTLAAEQLVQQRLPDPYSGIDRVFVSAHYGLLGYTKKEFFQVIVE